MFFYDDAKDMTCDTKDLTEPKTEKPQTANY